MSNGTILLVPTNTKVESLLSVIQPIPVGVNASLFSPHTLHLQVLLLAHYECENFHRQLTLILNGNY